jgi:hypothetical protein
MINSVSICIVCGKEMPAFYKGCSKTYDPKFHKNIYVCSNECKEKWEAQYFVEKYKGNKIYCIDGKYVPYLSCAYYFNTLEDCKKRIDKPHIAYVSREALRTFIREEFGND